MMLLRVCLPNDANAVYLIRELNDNGDFVDWKYITLGDLIMSAGWNLQAGGPGMGGQATQTVKIPYGEFQTLDERALSEENLKSIGNLPKETKAIAQRLREGLDARFG